MILIKRVKELFFDDNLLKKTAYSHTQINCQIIALAHSNIYQDIDEYY